MKNFSLDKINSELQILLPETFINFMNNYNESICREYYFKYFDISYDFENTDGVGSFLSLDISKERNLLSKNLSPPEFFPDNLVAFADTGGGDFICFDYRQGRDNINPPIVFWNHGTDIGKDVSFIASNFQEFIDMLKETDDCEDLINLESI